MCGRYALGVRAEDLYEEFEAEIPEMFERGRPRWERPQDYRPNYNIAPRSRAAVIRRDQDSGLPMIETMQWGLIPHWTKHPPTGGLNTINARSEALIDPSSGGMWHALKGYKRCIIPAQGYYEWQKKPSSKVAHFTRLPLQSISSNTPANSKSADTTTELGKSVTSPPLMFFAGLWDSVTYLSPVESRFQPSISTEDEDSPTSPVKEKDTREAYPTGNPLPLSTFTILTTTPSRDLSWLHDRMPCVLSTWSEMERWLDLGKTPKGWEEGKGGTADLLHSTSGLDCYPVPPEVGRIGTNSSTFIQPVSERSDGIKSFFQKQQPSPVKSKIGVQPMSGKKTSSKQMEEKKTSSEEKDQVKNEGTDSIKTEELVSTISSADKEKDLGDDSNAPNPDVKSEAKHEDEVDSKPILPKTPSGKRKAEALDIEPTSDPKEVRGERKGGHQTKVIRREDPSDKAQPSIMNFFKSPAKEGPLVEKPKGRAKSTRKGK